MVFAKQWYRCKDKKELSSGISKSKFYKYAYSLHTNTKGYKKTNETGAHRSITDMTLIGLYGSKNYGYAIVAMKSNLKKTSIIGVGETYNGYTFERNQ
ncbi:hypothetical protein [Sulfurimonas sp. NW9]|uniref:hypothetical protein n=1 Tax=Sulfurimonas sp. NW9 TaxID=2922728 RepID=UPI003DA9ED63